MENNNLTVIGISRSSGDYNGTQYDNTYLYCTRPADETKNQTGLICEIIKVKTASLECVPSIGSLIVPVYNRFGQVQTVQQF